MEAQIPRSKFFYSSSGFDVWKFSAPAPNPCFCDQLQVLSMRHIVRCVLQIRNVLATPKSVVFGHLSSSSIKTRRNNIH